MKKELRYYQQQLIKTEKEIWEKTQIEFKDQVTLLTLRNLQAERSHILRLIKATRLQIVAYCD